MRQTAELREAIENLYRAFEGYRLNPDTGPCPCCHSSEDNQRLRSKLLRNLGPNDLFSYSMDALYTWGSESDFKHFLPRIFELLTLVETTESSFVDPESAFGKLTYESCGSTSWRTWPTAEQQVISNYAVAVWNAVLDSDPDELTDSPYDWLCAFAQAESDLSHYLDQWMASSSVNAHRNLARMIVWDGVPNATRPNGGYWASRREQWQQLVDWLRRPEVKQKLASGLEKWSDSPFGGELLEAAVLLP
ncbi:MAG: hypothetical protein WCB94_11370 [Terriglobales bacterium]